MTSPKKKIIERALNLAESTQFLWGPRQTGKTTLLKEVFRTAYWIDLLKTEDLRRYRDQPELLREELAARPDIGTVVIDEIQNVPDLLNEVHWLIENRVIRIIMSGSSARKVRHGQANLLGGRAVRRELFGLTAYELKNEFDLQRLINHGYLPRMYLTDDPRPYLSAYVGDYLKEEIAAEGLVQRLPSFSEFLNVAALSDTELVNYTTIARECGVSANTVKNYFSILEGTLQGRWLPAYRKRPKRRVILGPKFYFSDVGVVNFLARRGRLEPKSELYGKAFENWVFHELTAYNAYRERYAQLSYWRLASGIEVDFIVNDMDVAIEAKATAHVRSQQLKPLHELSTDHPRIRQRILVCLETRPRKTEDNILILPAANFVERLWGGDLF